MICLTGKYYLCVFYIDRVVVIVLCNTELNSTSLTKISRNESHRRSNSRRLLCRGAHKRVNLIGSRFLQKRKVFFGKKKSASKIFFRKTKSKIHIPPTKSPTPCTSNIFRCLLSYRFSILRTSDTSHRSRCKHRVQLSHA